MARRSVKTARKRVSLPTRPGPVIPGYSIIERVGRGGMGSVYKAVQLSMDRILAVKVLPVSLARDKRYIRRFLREARSAAQMNHPNLTRVYDVGSHRGVFYFSMEFVEGATLLALINSEVRIDPLTATDIVLQAARGLRHAHSHRIVHRDIKPENIMIAMDGAVKITDMGLAKRIDSTEQNITHSDVVIGTPCYMSPEQITRPRSVDHHSDIYSLGATFYHMVTGGRPFRGENFAQTLLMVVGEEPDWPHSRDVPVRIVRVIKRMMDKNPARRFQSTEELIRELIYVKEKMLSPHRSRRLALFSATTPGYAAGRDDPVGELEAPSRRVPMVLALCALLVVLLALIFYSPREPVARVPRPTPTATQSSAGPPPGRPLEEYLDQGEALVRQGRWVEALPCFDRAKDANPLSAEAWKNRGLCLWHLARYREALTAYEQAAEILPDAHDIQVHRGLTLLVLERHEDALEAFETAIRLKPEFVPAWEGKAKTLRALERPEEAAEAEAKAMELKK